MSKLTTTTTEFDAKVESEGLNLEAFRTYLNNEHRDIDENWEDHVDDFKEAFTGEFETQLEFTDHIVEESGLLIGVDEKVKMYFDYEKYGRDLLCGDYWENNNYYFRG